MNNMSENIDVLHIPQSDQPLILNNNNYKRPLKRVPRYDEFRIISKKGKLNVHLSNIPEKSIRYMIDLWNTLVNMRWRWLLIVIALINLAAYLSLAVLFLLDAWVSGDFDEKPQQKKCVIGMHNFTSYFMLGIETITTTGYGYFHPSEFCYLVFMILTASTMATIFIDGAFISVVYAKFIRPTYKYNLFSKRAVICMRNGKLCLMIRVNDGLRKHWIDNKISMFFIKSEKSKEGEIMPNFIQELPLQPYGMLCWPIEIVHEITASSPLWNISAKDLLTTKFEIATTILGSSLQTGQLTKTQTSYLAKEIMWGYRFMTCLEYNFIKMEYIVNRKAFNETISQDTPLCSASILDQLQKGTQINSRRNSVDGTCSLENEPNQIT